MLQVFFRISCAALLCLAAVEPSRAADPFTVRELPPLPDNEGFAGAMGGVSGDHVLVIGGANFPAGRPWEGGKKVWYDHVFALSTDSLHQPADSAQPWKLVGTVPRPIGYGVSVTFADRVICVGGSNAEEHRADALSLSMVDGQLQIRKLPSLPAPRANHFGAVVGSLLIVGGGQSNATSAPAESSWLAMDLHHPAAGWKELPPCPGQPRILATAAAVNGKLWIAGGASLAATADNAPQRSYLLDAWQFDPQQNNWIALPRLMTPSVAAPSPAPVAQQSMLLLGGDDGKQVGVAPDDHKGFPQQIRILSTAATGWMNGGSFPPAVVTATPVFTPHGWVIPSGEIRPGIRSPKVWLLQPAN